jgi:predicted MFS family arabinose efflux permease
VLLVAAVQFVNILDFMMVMPLGPFFASALQIPLSHLGYIGGSYTAAAFVTGVAGAFFLDRFDRRTALGVAMLGLVAGTALGGVATGFPSLLFARVVAGAFGGPATSIALSIIADAVPADRRGRAMGVVMSAFAIASVLGVPAGLELAEHGGWRAPFFAVAAVGFLLAALAVRLLPPMRAHLTDASRQRSQNFASLFRRGPVLLSYAMTFTVMSGMFALIPNIAAYVQNNLGFPRAHLGRLYLMGGVASFMVLRVAGPLVDRLGPTIIGTLGTALTVVVVWAGFVSVPPPVPVAVVFVAFMASTGFRNVAYNTLTSRVPHAEERARFMSVQSAVQHIASAIGAFLSSRVLSESTDGRLLHMNTLAIISISLILVLPLLMAAVDRAVGSDATSAH